MFLRRKNKIEPELKREGEEIYLTYGENTLVYNGALINLSVPGRTDVLVRRDVLNKQVVNTLVSLLKSKLNRFGLEVPDGVLVKFCSAVLNNKTAGIVDCIVNYSNGEDYDSIEGEFFYAGDYFIMREHEGSKNIKCIAPSRELHYFDPGYCGPTIDGYKKLLEKVGCREYNEEELSRFISGEQVSNVETEEVVEYTMGDVIEAIRNKMPSNMRNCNYSDMLKFVNDVL